MNDDLIACANPDCAKKVPEESAMWIRKLGKHACCFKCADALEKANLKAMEELEKAAKPGWVCVLRSLFRRVL